MVRWAKKHGSPRRIVDAGAGTGRFTFAAAEAFPDAEILAIEVEPKSVRYLRKRVAESKHGTRIHVMRRDYLNIPALPEIIGQTLFIGNPPYVRHHLVSSRKKQIYLKLCREFGLQENTKAGLHLHFFLKTRQLAKPNDYGIFIAAAEWIHSDYGGALRALLIDGMGGLSIDTFAAKSFVFPNVMTTAAVVCFEIGARGGAIAFSEVRNQEAFRVGGGTKHAISSLRQTKHWSAFARGAALPVQDQCAKCIRDVFRVRRGQVTGAKSIWTIGRGSPMMPDRFLFPTITARPRSIKRKEMNIYHL